MRVIDLTINVLGPVATMILGDMGADVIKVETPDGDPNRQNGPSRNPNMAAMHLNMNRNKRSVTLNLKRPEAREALLRMVERRTCSSTACGPAAAKRLGIAYEDIAARNPRIVYGYGCGYMPGGPRENDPAFDDVVQGEAGIADLMLRSVGQARYLPTVHRRQVLRLHAGLGRRHGAVCARAHGPGPAGAGADAGDHRRLQPAGAPVGRRVRSADGRRHRLRAPALRASPPLRDAATATSACWPSTTSNGSGCCPRSAAPSCWPTSASATHDGRMKNIDRVYGMVSDQMKTQTTAQWHELLNAIDMPNGPVARFEDMLADPYLNETGFFQRYEHPTEGPMVTTAVPTQFSATPGGIHRPPPQLGEHNDEVLGCVWLQCAKTSPA